MRHTHELVWRKRKGRKGKPVAYIFGPGLGRHGKTLGTTDPKEATEKFREVRDKLERAAEDSARLDDQPIRRLIEFYILDPENTDPRFLDRILLAIGDKRVSELTSEIVTDIARATYPKAKPQTINRQFLTPLAAVIRYNAGRRRCPPLSIIRLAPAKTARKEAVTMEWVAAFANAAKDNGFLNLAAMETFMATSGARRGSCLRLLPEDIDFDKRTALLRDTKTGDDVVAQLSLEALAVLRELPMTPGVPVFGYQLDKHGVPPKRFYRDWQAVCRLAGIPYIPPHQSGRHTFATHMIVNRGIDPFTVAKLAGWKGTRMLDKYVQARADVKVVDDAFSELQGRIAGRSASKSAIEPPDSAK